MPLMVLVPSSIKTRRIYSTFGIQFSGWTFNAAPLAFCKRDFHLAERAGEPHPELLKLSKAEYYSV